MGEHYLFKDPLHICFKTQITLVNAEFWTRIGFHTIFYVTNHTYMLIFVKNVFFIKKKSITFSNESENSLLVLSTVMLNIRNGKPDFPESEHFNSCAVLYHREKSRIWFDLVYIFYKWEVLIE